ncbi:MAG: hypothetical protein LW884_08885 [Bacteroidetes bacterium]|jgi:uncharacterized protein YicC (UPF0701 family)|nr:hypothetical protein [Bacteroidota bacterium]
MKTILPEFYYKQEGNEVRAYCMLPHYLVCIGWTRAGAKLVPMLLEWEDAAEISDIARTLAEYRSDVAQFELVKTALRTDIEEQVSCLRDHFS